MGLFSRKPKEPEQAASAPAEGEAEVHLPAEELQLRGDADGLLMLLRSGSDPEERAKAAWALVDLKDARAEPALIDIVSDASQQPGVRFQAIGALGKMHAVRAVGPLTNVLTDAGEEDKVRAGAAVSLGWIGDAAASEALAEVWLVADDERLREAAGRAFLELGVTQSACLVAALDDPDRSAEAASRLAKFADQSVVPILRQVAEQARERKAKKVAAAAEEAIESIQAGAV